MKVSPALPTPGELVRLPLPCPPQLVELSGYSGGARLIALWRLLGRVQLPAAGATIL